MLLVGAFVFALLFRLSWMPYWLALLLSIGAGSVPYVYVLRRRAKRFDEFEKQFPAALDFLSRSLRAGHPMPVSLELLAQEESPPLSIEMRKTAEERRLGMQQDDALENLAKRLPLVNVRIFVAAVKSKAARAVGSATYSAAWPKACGNPTLSKARSKPWPRTAK